MFNPHQAEVLPIPEARRVFCLTQSDLTQCLEQLPFIQAEIAKPPRGLPAVGKTWSRVMPLSLRRKDGSTVPIVIKKPHATYDPSELFKSITQHEYRLLQHGLDCFAPTYPLADTGLFVQYYGESMAAPQGQSLDDLKNTFEQYLASKGLGVRDIPNNAKYTEHGWLLFDVDDVVSNTKPLQSRG
jgi:hypothetical protein